MRLNATLVKFNSYSMSGGDPRIIERLAVSLGIAEGTTPIDWNFCHLYTAFIFEGTPQQLHFWRYLCDRGCYAEDSPLLDKNWRFYAPKT